MLGAGADSYGPPYALAPVWDMAPRDVAFPAGEVGRRAASLAYQTAGLSPADVDVAELYDPFSFEIIRQLEVHGFCAPGEGGPFVEDGNIEPGGLLPVNTDGGLLSFSHAGVHAQHLQRIIRAVHQLRGTCPTNQVDGAEVALCSGGGAGALFNDVLLLGVERP
jgi:acetyl-CoA acetyltransferase